MCPSVVETFRRLTGRADLDGFGLKTVADGRGTERRKEEADDLVCL